MPIDNLILIAVSFAFLYFALSMKDYATYLFSSITFVFAGLNIIINGISGVAFPYAYSLGILLIGYGIYVSFRSGIELIKEGFEGWQIRKRKKNPTRK